MLGRRHESGEGQMGCIVGLIIMIAAGFIAYKMIPIKVKAADLRQTVINEARSAGTHTDKVISGLILNKAKELELPVTEKDLKINRAHSAISVTVEYTVPIEFPGYTFNWKFRHHAANPIF